MREMNFVLLEPEVPENVNGPEVSQDTVLTQRHFNLWGIRTNGSRTFVGNDSNDL